MIEPVDPVGTPSSEQAPTSSNPSHRWPGMRRGQLYLRPLNHFQSSQQQVLAAQSTADYRNLFVSSSLPKQSPEVTSSQFFLDGLAAPANVKAQVGTSDDPAPTQPWRKKSGPLQLPNDIAEITNTVDLLFPALLLGELLVQSAVLTPEELQCAIQIQALLRNVGREQRLGELLLRLGMVRPDQIEQALYDQQQS